MEDAIKVYNIIKYKKNVILSSMIIELDLYGTNFRKKN